MSAFEVVVTPPRQRNAKKTVQAREPVDVVMAPFTSKSIVTFEDIPVSKTARRFLNIRNPTSEPLNVALNKGFRTEFNITVEWTSKEIAPSGVASMEILWVPCQEITCKETIQFIDNRNFKKDVMVILKSIDKKIEKKNTTKPMGFTKKLKLKSPSPPKRFRSRTSSAGHTMTRKNSNKNANSPIQSATTTFVVELSQAMNQASFNFSAILSPLSLRNSNVPSSPSQQSDAPAGKENRSPNSPNVSVLFDKINFTPIAQTARKSNVPPSLDVEYLANLPTPKAKSELIPEAPKSILKSSHARDYVLHQTPTMHKRPSPHSRPSTINLFDMETPNGLTRQMSDDTINLSTKIESFQPMIVSSTRRTRSLSEIPDSEHDVRKNLFNVPPAPLPQQTNTTFKICDGTTAESTPPKSLNWSPKQQEFATPAGLAAILEESAPLIQETFNISPQISQATTLTGTPLRKKFQSMKDLSNDVCLHQQQLKINQGSMPNLNEYHQVKTFENNRYFNCDDDNQSNLSVCSTISVASTTHEVVFNKNEIKAQSSRFNINEIGKPENTANSFYFDMSQNAGSSNNRRNDCFVAPRQLSIAPPRKSHASSSIGHKRTGDSGKCVQQKRTKLDETDDSGRSTSSSQSSNSRLSSWAGAKRKVSVNTTQLILKKQREERVIMFDPDLHIQSVINPDPFAATTTCDPFLASTMYLDERSIDKNESHFIKWLNALVTIPADLEITPKQVDYGKLFNEVRNKDLTLAETKEVVSMNYLTKYRMNSLRKAAIKLYLSNDLRGPFEKLAVHIEKKYLVIRSDRNLHLDMVLQRVILDLLLCFNPIWLRIGLEVIYGEQIYVQHNSDVFSLSVFIINRMFRDKYLEEKYSRHYTRSNEYAEHMRKFTLRKIIMLLVFLDKAKNSKMIVHNPCLFVKSSPYKETKDVLLKFSTELLGNVGDVQKDLKRIGIVLTHKQTFLDEFDYAFRNLAVDLRDGVRLTKVMEIIMLRDDLIPRLRVPAISRLQKVHNVNLALQALKEAEFSLTGYITANDIVDGHREKTLSLLWQIIYKFRAPKFNAAATIIQKWWRKSWLQVFINRKIEQKRHQRKVAAAIVIQKTYRGLIARRYVEIYRTDRLFACIVIQSNWRRKIAMRTFHSTVTRICYIQRWYRNIKRARNVRENYLAVRSATVQIQKWWRRVSLAKKIESLIPIARNVQNEMIKKRNAAVFIQRKFRATMLMKKERANFLTLRNAAVNVQIRFRARIAMKETRQVFLKLKSTTVMIQQRVRAQRLMKIQRKVFVEQRIAAIFIQRKFRANKEMERCKIEFTKTKTAAITIQQRYRALIAMRVEKQKYQKIQRACFTIQQRYEAHLQGTIIRAEYLKLQSAAIQIQRKYRAILLMRNQRAIYVHAREMIVFIQQTYRRKLQMKKERSAYLSLVEKTILIQRKYRAKKAMERDLENYQLIQRSVVTIQRWYIASHKMQIQKAKFIAMKHSAVVIQQRFRATLEMCKERQKYVRLQSSAKVIQRRYRALREMRQQRQRYLLQRNSVILIQRYFRGNIQMKLERGRYLTMKKAAITIQRRYRAKQLKSLEMNKYNEIRNATITIQRFFVSYLMMKKKRAQFVQIQQSTLKIQQYYRSILLARKTRSDYLAIKSSAIVIQQRFRANLLMEKQRNEYKNLCKATVRCQNQFRANKLMKNQRHKYVVLKKVAIIIQQRFRANRAMKRARFEYLQLRRVTINCQQRFTANIKMMEQRCAYLELKRSTISIQRMYRGKIAMRIEMHQYHLLKSSCISIQRQFRAIVARDIERNKYLQIRNSAVIIQRRWIATLKMRQERKSFLQLNKSVVFVQRLYRARNAMRKTRSEYLKQRTSVIILQNHFKGLLQTRRCSKAYQQLRSAAATIQQRFRAQRAMIHQRNEFVRMKSAAIKIQRQFIAHKIMKQQLKEYQEIRCATIVIQRFYRAYIVTRNTRLSYLEHRQATITIQRYFRGWCLMKQNHSEYLKMKQSTITIQRWYRSICCTRLEVTKYQKMRTATIKIQTKFRAYLQMKQIRMEFLQLKKAAIIIQQRYRAKKSMIKERSTYLALKMAVVFVQRKFKSNQLTKTLSNQYKLIRCLCICIQRKFRANIAMKRQRQEYLKIRNAAIVIQRRFKAKQNMLNQRKLYLHQKQMIVNLQARCRGFIGRQNYQQMLTPEVLTLKRQQRAVRKIQAQWRGYVVRRKESRAIQQIRNNIKMISQNAKPENSIRNRLVTFVKLLKGRHSALEALNVLTRLANISRVSPQFLINDASFVANFCYGIMSQAIRSELDKQLIENCSFIILNLARYEPTKRITFQRHGLVTIAQMLLRWCDKTCAIFDTLCTVIWIFSQCRSMNQQIREFMTIPEAVYMLHETRKLVARKENMRRNQRQQQKITNFQRRQRPMIEPDFGLPTKKLYIFCCSVFAFDTILAQLEIQI